MIQDVMSVIAAFFGSLGFSIIYNIRGQRLWIPSIGGAVFWALYLVFLYFVDNEYLGIFRDCDFDYDLRRRFWRGF